MSSLDELQRRKEQLRREARTLRQQQTDRETLSQAIHQRVVALPEYAGRRR